MSKANEPQSHPAEGKDEPAAESKERLQDQETQEPVGSRILHAPAAHVIPDYPGRSRQMTRCLSARPETHPVSARR